MYKEHQQEGKVPNRIIRCTEVGWEIDAKTVCEVLGDSLGIVLEFDATVAKGILDGTGLANKETHRCQLSLASGTMWQALGPIGQNTR